MKVFFVVTTAIIWAAVFYLLGYSKGNVARQRETVRIFQLEADAVNDRGNLD
jgi:membrane protein DedA with SNARE-associated domain